MIRAVTERVELPSLQGAPARMALGNGTLIVADHGNTLHSVVGWDGEGAVRTESVALAGVPSGLAVSPSAQHVLITYEDSGAIDIMSLPDLAPALSLTVADAKASRAACLSRWQGAEFVLVSPERAVLEARSIPDGELAFKGAATRPNPFVFDRLVPVLGADEVVAIGYFHSETRDSLFAFSFAAAVANAGAVERAASQRDPIEDYAYRIAAGPAPPAGIVVFRDPEDAEDDPDSEDGALYGFRGLYTRRLADGQVTGRFEYDGPVPSGSPLFASESAIVVGRIDGVEVVPRAGSAERTMVYSTVYALDAGQLRFAVLQPDGSLTIYDAGPS